MNNADLERMVAIRRTMEPDPGEIVYVDKAREPEISVSVVVDTDKIVREISDRLSRVVANPPEFSCYLVDSWDMAGSVLASA